LKLLRLSAFYCVSTQLPNFTCGSVMLENSQKFFHMSVFSGRTHDLQMCKYDIEVTFISLLVMSI